MEQVETTGPRTVKSLVVERLGNPTQADGNVFGVAQRPVPPLAANAVRIRVVAAALNFADALQVQVSREP
jgi:NADPH:quinone reductase-like Zn-dependent oxidoreductase